MQIIFYFFLRLIIFALVLFLTSSASFATTYYVNVNTGNDSNNGTTTSTPWKTLRKAWDSAVSTPVVAGDTILVAEGTYSQLTGEIFAVKPISGTTMIGGYDSNFTQYDPVNNPTIISSLWTSTGATFRGVRFVSSNSSTLFKGFTIRDNKVPTINGGGIAIDTNSSPVIEDCIIDDNNWSGKADGGGGGIYITSSSPTFRNCNISNNGATNKGAGIYITTSSNPTFENCTISGNSTTNSDGAGIYINQCSATITGCTIYSNTAQGSGGAIKIDGPCSPSISNCTIHDNTANTSGGGISVTNATPSVTSCNIYSNTTTTPGALDHLTLVIATPQTNNATFTGTNVLGAEDANNDTITTFDASSNNVTLSSTPDDGTITGLGSGGNNVLNRASDFSSGIANLSTLGMKFTGTSGTHTFTATSATSKTGTSGTVTINPGAITKLVFTTTTQTLNTNTASGVITVQSQDISSNVSVVGSDQTINLTSSSSTGRFDTSSTGNFDGSVTSTTIPSGSSSANFYYRDSKGGIPTITASAEGQSWTSATQNETINSPTESGSVSGEVIKDDTRFVRAKIDIYNLPANTRVDKAVYLTSIYTGNNGDYGTDLPNGNYMFKFSNITGYNTFQSSANVMAGTIITLSPKFIDPAGVVYDSATKTALQGATVTITETDTGIVTYTTNTGADGRYAWLAAQAKRYTITVTPPASYSFPSTVIQALTPPDPLPGPAQNDLNGLATGRYYLNFRFVATSGDLINNDIPLDMGNLQNLRLQKTINKKRAFIGDVIVYTITIENPNNFTVNNFYIEDLPAPQIKYLDGSSFYNGNSITPTNKSPLVFNGLSIAGNAQATLSYKSVIGSHVQLEKAYTNRAIAKNTYGSEISNLATAQIKIAHDPLFDEATVIGVVFEDKNRNGEFDADEKGIPYAQIYEVTGICITTDENGKWHLSALKPNKIYLFKIFPYTLPGGAEGWEYTTDNPRWLKVTRGSLYEINFGVTKKS